MQDENAISYRLSPQQELAWAMSPDGPADAGQLIVGLEGPVDIDRLRTAFSSLVGRHEILRTTYVRQPGMKTPLQVVRDAVTLDWDVADLTALDPASQRARMVEVSAAERRRSWDYENGPLLSARCLAMAPDRLILVVTAAAPCVDAGALATIAAELAAQYAVRAVDQQPLQYADFSEWQNQLAVADDEDAEAGRQFWSDAAPGATTAVPFMRRVTPAATETVPVMLPGLESVAYAHGTSLASLVFAAWVVVLWKLNEGDDVVVASLSPRRLHAELETAVGAFSRPLPVGVNLSDDLTAGDLAAQLARSQELAERWQDFAPADGDVCGAGFVEIPHIEPMSDDGITMSCVGISPPGVFPVSLESDGTTCVLRYEPSALDRASAERLARHVGCVLVSIVSAPETSIAEINLLDEADTQRLTVEVNDTSTAFPQTSVPELIAQAAASAPTQDAVVDETGAVSYATLEARSNQLAHRLRSAGVGPDSIVALCTDRSVEMIVGLLGILKAGGAYLPLNFEHPPARLAHQLRETEAPVLVTQASLLDRLPEFEGEVVCLDRDRESLDGEPATAPDVAVSPDNLAYVIYTSGSTGTPKGVGVTHGNLANYVHAITARLGADEAALAFGMVTAISTDLGNTAVFPALCTGGTLVLVSPAAAADAAAAAAYLRAHPVDVLKITPSHLNALLVGSDGADVLPKRWLVMGGEALSWDIVKRVRELGSCRILNHYGPTETTVGSCTFLVEESEESPQTATAPIGSPLANTRCYVLDENGRPVPEGVVGELFIAGAGVASGYVRRPDLTEERFLPDPFTGQGRMYATGDAVRRLPEGDLEFMGRGDDQVKIRGFRVEPAEIEAALRSHAHVDEAVVVAPVDARGEHRLIAYVVASNVTTDELRRHLADWIPEFMIPSTFVPIDAVPRTASGKIDRLSLPSPESASAASAGPVYAAPRTPVEEAIAAIWADVLGIEKVGVDDDFFALGGHSLLATQIVAQLRSDFAVNLPLHALFSFPTVATLSQQVVELMGGSSDLDTQGLIAELEGLSEEEVARLLQEGEEAGSSRQ
jgi:amino acid adenylation domain-containing protein